MCPRIFVVMGWGNSKIHVPQAPNQRLDQWWASLYVRNPKEHSAVNKNLLGNSSCPSSNTGSCSTSILWALHNNLLKMYNAPNHTYGENKIWWLCLVPTSTTRFVSDVGYIMAKKLIGLYKEIIFKNSDIKLLNIEWRAPYPFTNFEDHFTPNMCGILFVCTLASTQTLLVNWQN